MYRIISFKLLLIAFLCTGMNANAQTLTGLVYDKDTKQPISDAYVFIGGMSILDVTKNSGRFTLTVQQLIVNPKLVLSHLAYNMLVVDDPFNLLPDTIYMEGQVNILEEVTVSAQKKETESPDLKVNVANVIDVPALIKKRPSIRTLAEVFEKGNVPGLDIQRTYTGEITVKINRGDPNPIGKIAQTTEKKKSDLGIDISREPLIVVDGTPVRTFDDANRLLNNPEYIKNIEVNKSGAGWGLVV